MIPSTFLRIVDASTNPLRLVLQIESRQHVSGTTALAFKPSRVTNIFICSLVVFCLHLMITNASLRVRPRMNAMGRH